MSFKNYAEILYSKLVLNAETQICKLNNKDILPCSNKEVFLTFIDFLIERERERERERKRERERERQREGEIQNPKPDQALRCQHRAQHVA